MKAPVNWLGADLAMTTLIIVSVWGAMGNYMVYFLAGMQQIPQEVLESAALGGKDVQTELDKAVERIDSKLERYVRE